MIRLRKRSLIVGIIAASVALGVVAVAVGRRTRHMVHEHAGYYCPMHPGIVKDRPGDCPVCSMTLVKREPERRPSPPAAAPPQKPQTAKDICYLHNCPMVKPGQPCPMLVVAKAGEKVTCPICGTHVAEASAAPGAGTKKIRYWTDPMLPGYKSDKPGKSPMGMDLVPVYEEEHDAGFARQATAPPGYAPIFVTPEKRQFIGVKTAPVQRRAMTKTVRTVGLVAHDPELYQAQQEFINALHALQQAQAGTIPEVKGRAEQLVESSRLRLRHLGLTEELIEEVGTWTKPDHQLLIGGAGQSWVYAQVYEYELPLVHRGQAVTVDAGALPGRTFAGTVKALDPMLDPMTRTARVRALVDDPEGLLRPEMYVNVLIRVDLGESLAVPEGAVFATGTRHIIFVDKDQGLFEPRDVTVGVKGDGYVEVKEGLAEQERVVTSGNFLIDSESRLKAALQEVTDEGDPHAR